MYRMQREVNFILSVLRGLRNGTAERRTEFIGSVLADGDDRLDPTIVDLLSANTTAEFLDLLDQILQRDHTYRCAILVQYKRNVNPLFSHLHHEICCLFIFVGIISFSQDISDLKTFLICHQYEILNIDQTDDIILILPVNRNLVSITNSTSFLSQVTFRN